MTHEVATQWMGKMQFNALVDGHTVVMDAPERVGGEDLGPTPKPVLLASLAGCTGMDVVSLLHKWGNETTHCSVNVSGTLNTGTPITYAAAHIVYAFSGEPANQEAAVKAVTLSQERYCGVSKMLKQIMPVTWQIEYNGVVVFNNRPEAETHP